MSHVLRCSFCGKSQNEVSRLFAAGVPGVFICDECVRLLAALLDGAPELPPPGEPPAPKGPWKAIPHKLAKGRR